MEGGGAVVLGRPQAARGWSPCSGQWRATRGVEREGGGHGRYRVGLWGWRSPAGSKEGPTGNLWVPCQPQVCRWHSGAGGRRKRLLTCGPTKQIQRVNFVP